MDEHNSQPVIVGTAKNKKGLRTFLYGLFTVVLATAAGVGVYAWQQGKIDDLQHTKSQQQSTQNNTTQPTTASNETKKETQYKTPGAPFTFTYNSDWSVVNSDPLDPTLPAPNGYTITLTAPGTFIKKENIGSEATAKGARIVFDSSKTTLTDVNDRYKDSPYIKLTNKKEVTVAGIKGVQYGMGYESEPAIYTDFIKAGRLYSIAFHADTQNKEQSAYYPDYQKLLSTLAF